MYQTIVERIKTNKWPISNYNGRVVLANSCISKQLVTTSAIADLILSSRLTDTIGISKPTSKFQVSQLRDFLVECMSG